MSKIIIRATISALDHVLDHVATGYLVPAICMLARTLMKMERILSLCGLSLTKHATRLPSDRLPIVCTCSPVRRPRKEVVIESTNAVRGRGRQVV